MTLILGLDPGSVYTGYGIIEHHNGNSKALICDRIACGRGDFSERLEKIYSELQKVIEEYKPHQAAIESVFVQKNAMSALKLGHARGVAMVVCALHQMPISEYTPRQVKKAITGYGAAEKSQMQFMIRATCKLAFTPSEDAADALAVAITHAATLRHPALQA